MVRKVHSFHLLPAWLSVNNKYTPAMLPLQTLWLKVVNNALAVLMASAWHLPEDKTPVLLVFSSSSPCTLM